MDTGARTRPTSSSGWRRQRRTPKNELECRIRLHAEAAPGLLDVVSYHQNLDNCAQTALHNYLFADGIIQSTWAGLIRLKLSSQDMQPPGREQVRATQKTAWGRHNSDHALVEFSPIASPGLNQWHAAAFSDEAIHQYRWLNNRNDTIAHLQTMVNDGTHPLKNWLLELRNKKPEKKRVIVAYGAVYWPVYQQIIGGAFHPTPLQNVAGIRPMWHSVQDNRLVLLIYGPTARGWSNAGWDALGKAVGRWLQGNGFTL